MHVAITGASGFIGAALARRHLERGDAVRILVRNPQAPVCRLPGVRAFVGDLAQAPALAPDFLSNADVLYHCAAETRDERRMPAVNCEGTRRLAGLAAGRVGRWVQVSSAAVYGAVRSGTITEDSPLQPDSPYGRTKAESEAIPGAAPGGGGYQLVVLRPSNVFGAGMPGRALYKLFDAVRRGRFCFVGQPRAMMNYVPVEDVVAALVLCGTDAAAAGRTFNVSDQLPIEAFVGIIADAVGARRAMPRLPEPPLRLAASLIGWLPGVPLTHRHLDALTCRARYATDRLRNDLDYRPAAGLAAGLVALAQRWRVAP